MAAIMEIAGRHNLVVVEDACQAHGATFEGQPVGSFGTGCFSFYATKNMTTGEGGMITTDNDDLAEQLRLMRNHGQSQRYQHDTLGYHFRTNEIHAAIGLAQLDKLPAWNEQRIANASYLSGRLQGVCLPSVRPNRRHVFHQYTIRVSDDRQMLRDHLRQQGIGTAIHYPCSIHHQPAYRSLGYDDVLPEAETASREVLSLPVHPALSQSDLARIVAAVNGFAALT